MAVDEAKFRRLKEKAETARAARDKAAGQLEATMDRLKNEFQCQTVAAAKKKASELKREAAAAEKDYNKAVASFEEAWDEHLED
jgi:hypothetical protein